MARWGTKLIGEKKYSGLLHLDISKDKLQNKKKHEVRQNLFLPQFDSMPKEFDVDLYDFDPDNELHY